MKFKKVRILFSAVLVVVGMSIILSGCKCNVKDDQLAKLAELRRQEKSLNSEVSEKQSAKAKIDSECQKRTTELKDCNGKKEIVKQRLAA